MINNVKETGEALKFIVIPVTPATYSASVIPIILSVWLMSYVEPIADKISPKPVKFFTKPLITLVVTGTIAITALGPLGTIIGDGIAAGIAFLNNYCLLYTSKSRKVSRKQHIAANNLLDNTFCGIFHHKRPDTHDIRSEREHPPLRFRLHIGISYRDDIRAAHFGP